MNSHNDIAAELPPPAGDEPTSLRRDILDELADHLTCAADRESADEEDRDEEQVRERVLERFGNPARIARQLWFDAIKGKLMLQKFATAFSATAAVAAIAGCVVLWLAVDSAREAVGQALAEQRRDREQMAKLNEQNARANAALLAKLDKLAADANKPAKSMDWNPLKFKLLLGEQGNEPAAGFRVNIDGRLYGGEKQGVEKKSDKNGVADFGPVRPGRYTAIVYAPWHFWRHVFLVVTPGEASEITVRCPKERVVETSVKLQAALPKDLIAQNAKVLVNLYNSQQVVGSDSWTRSDGWRYYLCSATKPATPFTDWQNTNWFPGSTSSPYLGLGSLQASGNYGSPTWWTADYRVVEMHVLVERNAAGSPLGGFPMSRRSNGTEWAIVGTVSLYDRKKGDDGHITFKPKAGRDNIWTIPLPETLLKDARATFKAIDLKQQQSAEAKKKTEQLLKSMANTGTPVDKLSDEDKRRLLSIVRYYLNYLDSNGDRKLQVKEWDASTRIKPIFLKAKIDLQKEMTEGEFLLHFIRHIGIDDPYWKRARTFSRSRSVGGRPRP